MSATKTAEKPGKKAQNKAKNKAQQKAAPKEQKKAPKKKIYGRPLSTLAIYKKPKLRGWIHLVVTPLALAASIVLLVLAPGAANKWAVAVFMVCSLFLFGISAMYHRITWTKKMFRIMRRWDHSNIFLLIAGTYTPIAIALFDRHDTITVLTIVWVGAVCGVALSIIWPRAPRWVYVPIYILLGWVAVYYMGPIYTYGGWAILWLLVAGGVAYTLGAITYALKWPDPSPDWFGFHEIFHTCTVIGWSCHCVAAYIAILR